MLLDKEVEKKVDEFEEKEDKKPMKFSKKETPVKAKEEPKVEEIKEEEIKEEDDAKGVKEDELKDGVVIDCENLNIRKEGKADAGILTVVPVGTEVVIDMKDNTAEFYNVILKDGTEGFAMKKYIKLV